MSDSDKSSITEIPVTETVDNIFVTPSVLGCNAIHDTKMVAELPFVGASVSHSVIPATSVDSTTIKFNHAVNMDELIDRGITFEIPLLTIATKCLKGLRKVDGGNTSTIPTNANADSFFGDVPLAMQNITMKNFASAINQVNISFGKNFNITVSDAALLNAMLPFYSDVEDHVQNPPLCYQRGFQHIATINDFRTVTTGKVGDNDADFFHGNAEMGSIYNPFSPMSAFPQLSSHSTTLNFRKASFGEGKIREGADQTGEGKIVYAEQDDVNLYFRDLSFSIPSDLFKENYDLGQSGIYGLSTITITISLDMNLLNNLLIVASDYEDDWSYARRPNGDKFETTMTFSGGAQSVKYNALYKISQVKSVTIDPTEKVKMHLTSRTPMSSVESELRENGDYFLGYKEYYVTTHPTTKVTYNRTNRDGKARSRDIVLHTMPSHIMFAMSKKNTKPGEFGFAQINAAKIVVNQKPTLFECARSLYKISRANGYFSSYNNFAHFTGSVCCVDTTSLSIASDIMVGEATNVSVNVTVDFSRIDTGSNHADGDENEYELVVVCIYDKVVHRKDQNFEIMEGYQLNDAKRSFTGKLGVIARSPLVYGAGFFSRVWRGIKKLPSAIAKASDLVGRYNPAVGKYAGIANSLINGGQRRSSYITGGKSTNGDGYLFMK